jgi:hypothetical protein
MFTNSGCVLFQFVVLNTLRVWFLWVTILIFKYTGEAYCMTESFFTTLLKSKLSSQFLLLVPVWIYQLSHFHETWCIIIFISHWSAIDISFIDQYYWDNRVFLSWLIIDEFLLQNGKFSDRSHTENCGRNSCWFFNIRWFHEVKRGNFLQVLLMFLIKSAKI